MNYHTGQPMSLTEKVKSFIREHHFSIWLKYGASSDCPYDSHGVWGDAAKIKPIMQKISD